MKKILISTVASGMLVSSLMAASSSNITLGSDANGTIQNLSVASSTVDLNVTAVADFTGHPAAAIKGIVYNPEIGLGVGNLITVRISNGYVYDVSGNNLYLVDVNASDNNATGGLVVAKMTDFVSSTDGKGYADLTFKFEQEVNSGQTLVVANGATDTNSSLTTDNGKKISSIISSTSTSGSNLAVIVNSGLACADWVNVSVVNSTDQSGAAFNVANAPISSASGNGVKVISALDIDKTVIGTPTATTGDMSSSTTCPTWECQIALPAETSFGATAATADCPTCTESTTPTVDCTAQFKLNYTAGTVGTNTNVSTIDFTMTASDITGLTSIKSSANSATTKATATLSGSVYSSTLSSTNGVLPTAANTVASVVTVDGTTVLAPRAFDLAVKANTSTSVDSITNFLKFTEAGTELKVSYMNASDTYRTFVRVTSDKAATLQAIVTTEDGSVSSRINVTKADGSAVEISAATGGAVVVEASDILRSATDAGFTGTGNRFNASIYVKTTGTVDAVAYQTAGTSGSQRYLPVNGATGGKK